MIAALITKLATESTGDIFPRVNGEYSMNSVSAADVTAIPPVLEFPPLQQFAT